MNFKQWLYLTGAVLIIGITSVSVYTVRQYLPLAGGVILSVFLVSACFATLYMVAYGMLHLREKKRKADIIHLEAHGGYINHGGAWQALYPASVHTAVVAQQLQRTMVQEVREPSPMPLALPSPALPQPLALPSAPTFASIAHQIAPGRLILGYGTRGPIFGDVTDLLSTAIVGRPGTGKTTMLRLACAQILQIGGQPILLDPHGSIADEVGDVIDCAESGQEISEFAGWIAEELNQRLTARRAKQPLRQPLLVLADEWPIISKLAPDALDPIQRLILEGRKVNMYALICGQGLPAELLGGTLARDALASRYVFNTTSQQARLAGLDNETAKTMLTLLDDAGPGKAILASSRRKPEIVAIPSIESSDLRSLVTVSEAVPVPYRFQEQGTVETACEAVPDVPVPLIRNTGTLSNTVPDLSFSEEHQERERIVELARQGVPRRDMCQRLGKGKQYYSIVKQVLDEEGL